jgi:hypothetical protein
MLGIARTAFSARAWAPTGPDPLARRTTTAATLSTFTFTAFNGAAVTTSLSQFGAGSLDLVSAGNNRVIQNSSWSGPFPSGTGDFCIEGWVQKPAARGTSTGDPIVNNQSGGLGIRFGAGYNTGGFNNLSLFARGQADLDYAAFTWPDDTWCHWAVQRKSGTISFWANGNKLSITGGSGGGARNFAAPSSADLSIGSYNQTGTDETMRSYLDEICVSNSWRYDDTYSTYTIPTSAFVVDTITDMLIHFDTNLTTAAT